MNALHLYCADFNGQHKLATAVMTQLIMQQHDLSALWALWSVSLDGQGGRVLAPWQGALNRAQQQTVAALALMGEPLASGYYAALSEVAQPSLLLGESYLMRFQKLLPEQRLLLSELECVLNQGSHNTQSRLVAWPTQRQAKPVLLHGLQAEDKKMLQEKHDPTKVYPVTLDEISPLVHRSHQQKIPVWVFGVDSVSFMPCTGWHYSQAVWACFKEKIYANLYQRR